MDDQFIWISYGRQDKEIYLVKLDKKGLLDSLVAPEQLDRPVTIDRVDCPAPKTSRYDGFCGSLRLLLDYIGLHPAMN